MPPTKPNAIQCKVFHRILIYLSYIRNSQQPRKLMDAIHFSLVLAHFLCMVRLSLFSSVFCYRRRLTICSFFTF